jgi:hypothetical protein
VINQGLDQKCIVCFYVLLDLASIYFLLARSGRKTDGNIKNIRMFIKFYMIFLASEHDENLKVKATWHGWAEPPLPKD